MAESPQYYQPQLPWMPQTRFFRTQGGTPGIGGAPLSPEAKKLARDALNKLIRSGQLNLPPTPGEGVSGGLSRAELHRKAAEDLFGMGETVPEEFRGPPIRTRLFDLLNDPRRIGNRIPGVGGELTGQDVPIGPTMDMYGRLSPPLGLPSSSFRPPPTGLAPVEPSFEELQRFKTPPYNWATQGESAVAPLGKTALGKSTLLRAGVPAGGLAAALVGPKLINRLPLPRDAKDIAGNTVAGAGLGAMGYALGPQVGTATTALGAGIGLGKGVLESILG